MLTDNIMHSESKNKTRYSCR